MQFAREPVGINGRSSVDIAFSKQAVHFDADDLANPILQSWRRQIYEHVVRYLKPGDEMLELNAGTGIDAFYFANLGCTVLATDGSAGMVKEMERKISTHHPQNISCRQLAFENLDQLGGQQFDYVFSNFGGLNCIADLTLVTRHLEQLLKPGAFLTWVVMPKFCFWELLRVFKGQWSEAFRRFQPGGATALLEGESFKTYYHSRADIRAALGKSFALVRSEGLGIFSAPPAAMNFYQSYPGLYRFLQQVDSTIRDTFPFNRWGDHIIVTFQKVQ